MGWIDTVREAVDDGGEVYNRWQWRKDNSGNADFEVKLMGLGQTKQEDDGSPSSPHCAPSTTLTESLLRPPVELILLLQT